MSTASPYETNLGARKFCKQFYNSSFTDASRGCAGELSALRDTRPHQVNVVELLRRAANSGSSGEHRTGFIFRHHPPVITFASRWQSHLAPLAMFPSVACG